MTNDGLQELVGRLAANAGKQASTDDLMGSGPEPYLDMLDKESGRFLRAFASLVAEECAKVCEEDEMCGIDGSETAGRFADAIRERFGITVR